MIDQRHVDLMPMWAKLLQAGLDHGLEENRNVGRGVAMMLRWLADELEKPASMPPTPFAPQWSECPVCGSGVQPVGARGTHEHVCYHLFHRVGSFTNRSTP